MTDGDELEQRERRALEAREAARRAEQTRHRGLTVAARLAALREQPTRLENRVQDGIERAVSAAEAAKVMQTRAVEGLERAARAYERVARSHEHAAEMTERYGGAAAPEQRIAAREAHEAARRARQLAVEARRSFDTAPSPLSDGEF